MSVVGVCSFIVLKWLMVKIELVVFILISKYFILIEIQAKATTPLNISASFEMAIPH